MIYLASCLDFESLVGLSGVELKPTDIVWVLPVCCMECDAPDYVGWEKVFGDRTNRRRENIDNLLLNLGANTENIHYFNYYDEKAPDGIEKSDCIVIPGGLMELGIERLKKFGLDSIIKNYSGKIIANSAGALLLFDCYMVSPNDFYSEFLISKGIGTIKWNNFLEVHYNSQDKTQQESIDKVVKEQKCCVYALEDGGALVLNNNDVIETRKCKKFSMTI